MTDEEWTTIERPLRHAIMEHTSMNIYDLSDALADEIAAQHAAALERCGIRVEPHSPLQDGGYRFYGVKQGDVWLVGYMNEDVARAMAHELASDLIEQGDLEHV